MQTTVEYVIPIFLAVIAVWLIAQDILTYFYGAHHTPGRTLKLLRRLVIAGLLLTVAYMMHAGCDTLEFARTQVADQEKHGTPIDHDRAVACLNYWGIVFSCVLATIVLAIWDVFDSFRHIKVLCEEYSKDEYSLLKRAMSLQQAKESELKTEPKQELKPETMEQEPPKTDSSLTAS